MLKPRIIFVLGPTSSGKTKVAYELAQEINGEIISCDSMQIYKDMEIITQAPDKSFLETIPHHLVSIIEPKEEYSVANFIEESKRIIAGIVSRSKIPVFAGGTGLYVKSLIDGLFSSPPKDENLRDALSRIAEEKGNAFLHNMLEELDSVTASKLHSNDIRRIIRALEVYKLTGMSMNEKKLETRGISESYDIVMFGLELPRELLYSRIEVTVDKMFQSGLVEQVEKLQKRQLSKTAEKALGLKEVKLFLDKKMTLDETRKELKKNTRRYAKRQLTWFRADKRIKWIDADRDNVEIVREMIKELQGDL